MWGLIIQAVLGALKAVLGLRASKEPTATDLAGQAATATTELHQEEAANAVTTQAAAARADADVAVVRTIAAAPGKPVVDPAVNDQLAKQFPGQFRD